MLPLEKKTTLRDLMVKDAMRIQLTSLPGDLPIESGIRVLIKYKVGALMITDKDGLPIGVVSKTDVMGAYYAAMALDTPLEQIMVSPPLFCSPVDSLESTLETMRSRRIYTLCYEGFFVRKGDRGCSVSGHSWITLSLLSWL
jgi:CBS domain-containing protein